MCRLSTLPSWNDGFVTPEGTERSPSTVSSTDSSTQEAYQELLAVSREILEYYWIDVDAVLSGAFCESRTKDLQILIELCMPIAKGWTRE